MKICRSYFFNLMTLSTALMRCKRLWYTLLIFLGSASSAFSTEVVICNKSHTTISVASFWMDGPLSCAFTRTNCSIFSEGWWNIDKGECAKPPFGLWYIAYLVISFRDANGKTQIATFTENNRIFSKQLTGSAGVRNIDACVTDDSFSRKKPGHWGVYRVNKCPFGYYAVPFSLYVRANEHRRQIVNIRL